MLIGSTRVLHFGQNKRATSLKFIPSQSSCRVLSIYPLCPIQPCQCRFLYCNLWARMKYFSKMQHTRVRDQPPLIPMCYTLVSSSAKIITCLVTSWFITSYKI